MEGIRPTVQTGSCDQRGGAVTETTPKRIEIEARDALVVVDIQRDFLPGGALGPGGASRLRCFTHGQ